MHIDAPSLQKLSDTIVEIGQQAQVMRDNGLSITTKADQDFVSQADVWVEKALQAYLAMEFPDSGF